MWKPPLHKTIFNVILIIAFSFLAYANTFHIPFHFDDKSAIVENPIVTDLQYFLSPSKTNELKKPLKLYSFHKRYIGYLTLGLNYKFHGLNVTGYHITNLFIHILNALLIYFLVVLAFKTPSLSNSIIIHYYRHIAIFTALFFVCHPIQTQAVTYIWQRITSLATMFYFLSLLAYVKWRISRLHQSVPVPNRLLRYKAPLFYLTSIAAAILAMKTKEIAFTLPVIIVLFEFMFFNGKLKRRIMYLIPLFLTMLIIPLSFMDLEETTGDLIKNEESPGDLIKNIVEIPKAGTDMSRHGYLFTQFRVIVTYIRLIFMPIHQNLDYDYPLFSSLLSAAVFPSFLFLVTICISGIYILCRFRHSVPHTRLIAFGIFWFFITLSVESSIIPIKDVINEHRMYLPSFGIFLAITTMLFMLAASMRNRQNVVETIVIYVLVFIVIVLSGVTHARNRVWKDEISLWGDVVSKSPNKARGHSNLGSAYMEQGLVDKAIEEYQIAIKLNPDYSHAHNNLGIAYKSRGLIDRAIEQYLIAIKLTPNLPELHYNLGIAYQSKGLTGRAIEQYQIAIKLNSDYSRAYANLGNAFMAQGLVDRAIEQYQIAIKLDPDYPEAHSNLGGAYLSQGSVDKAIEHLTIATKLRPDGETLHFNLGYIYLKKGDLEMARREFERVLQLNPQNKKAQKLLHSIIQN
jgi:tetratricopeptide (TPR) repeat protein